MGLRAAERPETTLPMCGPIWCFKALRLLSILYPAFAVPEAKEPSQSLAGGELIAPTSSFYSKGGL